MVRKQYILDLNLIAIGFSLVFAALNSVKTNLSSPTRSSTVYIMETFKCGSKRKEKALNSFENRKTMFQMSDCRVQKRANASLSLRLPRGRPPAVGVDSSLFNLTPPSAEAVTPNEESRVITEAVEESVVIEAKETPTEEKPTGIERIIPINVDETEKPVEIQAPSDTEPVPVVPAEVPVLPDTEKPVQPDADTPISDVVTEPSEDETQRIQDRFVLAERPDTNPNPHS